MKKIIRITESQLDGLIERAILKEFRVKKQTIDEDSILLRTLTRKSVMSFGKYKGQIIDEILRLGMHHYLRYIYYNLDGITFIDEILRQINIFNDHHDYRIPKPGKDPEYGKEIENILVNQYKTVKTMSHYKRKAKAREIGKRIVDAKKYGKGNLAWKNQGHR
jgi:hypothetical protein